MKQQADIAEEIQAYIWKNKDTHTSAAAKWKVSRSYLSRVVNNKAPPTEAMLESIGYERITEAYRKVRK